jgi:hypothetical protein
MRSGKSYHFFEGRPVDSTTADIAGDIRERLQYFDIAIRILEGRWEHESDRACRVPFEAGAGDQRTPGARLP